VQPKHVATKLEFADAQIFQKLTPFVRHEQKVGARAHALHVHASWPLPDFDVAGVYNPLEEDVVERGPLDGLTSIQLAEFEKNVHLQLGKFVMDEPKVELVKSQALTINLPSVGAPVAIRTEGDEVVVLVRLTLRPRNNVMNIDLDVSTGGDSAAVTRLNQDAPA
jgi:hypothetical protein